MRKLPSWRKTSILNSMTTRKKWKNLFRVSLLNSKKKLKKAGRRQDNYPQIWETMLQQQIILKSVIYKSESNIEELEQYGIKMCLCIVNVLVIENETSEDVLNNIWEMCKRENINIFEKVFDRAHRIGYPYKYITLVYHI